MYIFKGYSKFVAEKFSWIYFGAFAVYADWKLHTLSQKQFGKHLSLEIFPASVGISNHNL
jgi:hypothetical protein